jgi:hypothetical protein
MILDVVRPEFQRQTNAICSHVLASTLLQMVYQDVPWLNRTPGWVKRILYLVSRLSIRVILPIQRRAHL